MGGGPGTIDGGASGTWKLPPDGGNPVVGSGSGAVLLTIDLDVSPELGRRRCIEERSELGDPLLKVDGRIVEAVLLPEADVLELVGRVIERVEEPGRVGVLTVLVDVWGVGVALPVSAAVSESSSHTSVPETSTNRRLSSMSKRSTLISSSPLPSLIHFPFWFLSETRKYMDSLSWYMPLNCNPWGLVFFAVSWEVPEGGLNPEGTKGERSTMDNA